MPRIFAPQIAALNQKEKTWQAINVIQANPDVAFGSCQIVDETTGIDYICRPGGSCPFPVDIPFGHEVTASFLMENSGDIAIDVFIYIEIIDPDGLVRCSEWNPSGSIPNTINPGVGYYSKNCGPVSLDKTGLWLVYGRIEYEIA